ncbi:MAG: tetratricopeptide repeat protein [Desulfuromonadales bacterium]|nr:tetratricopeptide repeat protein [Desulfuromonadales bacterium]
MGFFDKMFGTKTNSGKIAAEAQAGDFVTALLMHLRGELEPALSAYQKIAEEFPEDTLAPFFAAAIRSDTGKAVEAADGLRSLSRRIAAAGEAISRAISLDLVSLVSDEPFLKVKGIPAVADIIVSFGDSLKQSGFVQESAVCFEIAAGLVPEHANVLYKLGDTLHDLGIYDYAESVLLEALKHAPSHWGALYTYAVLLQDLGRDEEAITYYGRAVRLIPDHVNSQNNYGAALLRANRLEEALVHCTLAANYDPDSPLVKINLGNIYLLMQEYETARTCFTEAISLNDKLAQAYFGLGSVEQRSGSDTGRIRELYLKAIQLNPSIPEIYQAVGNLFAGDGSPEALQYFSEAVQMNSNLKDLHKDFGMACLQQGQRKEALEHLRMALQQNPDDVMVQNVLAGAEAENPV